MKKLLLCLLCAALLCGCTVAPPRQTTPSIATEPSAPETTAPQTESTQPFTEPETEPATDPVTPPETQPETQPPQPERFLLSFAGDCTFGTQIGLEKDSFRFIMTVGEDYQYPLSNVRHIFENDDFSFVNLEGTLTDYNPTQEEMEQLGLVTKSFRFRGPKEYTQILTSSGVEFASVANNHARDYGMQGWRDTLQALDDAGVHYASYDITCLAETQSGLKIGIIAISFFLNEEKLKQDVAELRSQGAELIVLSIHWGIEKNYTPEPNQRYLAHMAIDNGVDIIFGHHSHTLQPIESYNDGIIFYSLGNFSFGGNPNPSDKDCAILQQEVVREADGSIHLGSVYIIPCRVSAVPNINDYRPTPYEQSDPGYQRVLDKLTGRYGRP